MCVYLVATILVSTDIEHVCHHIKFYWILLYYGGNIYALNKYLFNISQVLNTVLAKETPLYKSKISPMRSLHSNVGRETIYK